MYEKGYFSNGISFSSLISKKAQTFDRQYYSIYTLKTGFQYFFKPYLSLNLSITALASYNPSKTYFNLSLLDKNTFLVGLNFLIQSENE